MIAKLLFKLIQIPWFRRMFWKRIYDVLAREIPEKDMDFMNYGYVPNENEKLEFNIINDHKVRVHQLQLYYYLVAKVNVEGKIILEVGSGRGGGAFYVTKYFKPASYIGMDISQNAVDLANKLFTLPNLKFVQGNAETIPMDDNSMDVIVNVESSHGYGSVDKFLQEVKRVLKPGGYLLLTDFRYAKEMEMFRNQLKKTDMELLEEEEITNNVLRSIETLDDLKKQYTTTAIPPKWQPLFSEFSGCVGFYVHRKLKSRELLYYRFVLRKKG